MTALPAEEPVVLDVAAVLARYGLRDRRAARRVMDAAGSFVVAGKLFVRLEDLLDLEERIREERRIPEPPRAARRRRAARRSERTPTGDLSFGWWRDADGDGTVIPPGR